MKLRNPFKNLTKTEWALYLFSLCAVVVSSLAARPVDVLTTIASVLGATALIFVAKGNVFGQIVSVAFGVLYGIISLKFHYYGEMITYLGMSVPISVMSVVSWLRNPYKDTAEVKVHRLTKLQTALLFVLTAAVTAAFFFILRALGNANLYVSTLSIATSFSAAYLLLFRSPFYALAYSVNDIVLIVLWTLATLESAEYLPMIVCFVAFLLNDAYGFFNWSRMRKRQSDT